MEKIKYYPRVGHSKAKELYVKNEATLRVLTKDNKQTEVRDVIQEGIVREFIGQFIPKGYGVGRGFVYDPDTKKHSPETDAILYTGPPLMEFGDIVVTEKSQTKLMVEVKIIDEPFDVDRGKVGVYYEEFDPGSGVWDGGDG